MSTSQTTQKLIEDDGDDEGGSQGTNSSDEEKIKKLHVSSMRNQRPDMTVAVDWGVKHQSKQTNIRAAS